MVCTLFVWTDNFIDFVTFLRQQIPGIFHFNFSLKHTKFYEFKNVDLVVQNVLPNFVFKYEYIIPWTL